MSIAIAKGLYGIGAKGPQDRRRRQMEDEQFEREGERHDLSMERGQLGIQATEQQMDIRGEQAERAETEFEWAEEDRAEQQLARRTQEDIMNAMLKFEVEGNLQPLISTYSDSIQPVSGWSETQTPDGKRAVTLQFEDGTTRTTPIHSYVDKNGNEHIGVTDLALTLAKGDPTAIVELRRQMRQGYQEAQQAEADREFELRKIRETQYATGVRQIRVDRERARIDEETSEATGVPREEVNQIRLLVASSLGLDKDFTDFNSEDGQKLLRGTSIAANALGKARELGIPMNFATASMIAMQAVEGGMSEDDAKKMAAEQAREQGLGGRERAQFIEDRAAGLMAESRLAETALERLGGISELERPVGQRQQFAGALASSDQGVVTDVTDRALGIGQNRRRQPERETGGEKPDGKTPETAIPVEQLDGPPEPGTYLIRNGEVVQYRPQGRR